MGSKEKRHKKDKKHKKEKKDKSRKRDRSSSESGSDSEEERKRLKAEKKAKKVEEYWNKQANKGQTKFVWGKKIERDLLLGKDVKDFTAAAVQRKHEERMAEIEKVQKRREEREAEKQRMEEELALLQRQRLAAEAVEQEQKEEEFHLQQAQVRAARRLAQGRAKPIDWLVADLYGLGVEEDTDAANDGTDSEEEREQLRRQVEGDEWTDKIARGGRSNERAAGAGGGGYARPRGIAAEPYQVMFGLMFEDLQELHDEIKGYLELESHVTPINAEYWQCLLTLAEHELEALRLQHDVEQQQQQQGMQQYGGYGSMYGSAAAAAAAMVSGAPPRVVGAPLIGLGVGGVHSAVQNQIETLLSGQTYSELMALEKDVERKLAAGEGDPEYWEAVVPRLKIHAAKARLRELKAEMLEQQLAAQEEKLDVAAAMGWMDEQEQEADEEQKRLGDDGVNFPQGAAKIVQEGDIPLSDSEEYEQQQQQRRQLHPDEELEQQQAAEAAAAAAAEQQQQQQQQQEEWEPEALTEEGDAGTSTAAVGAAARRPAAAVAASDGRHSPPPVDPAEVAAGEYEVLHEEEDARMLELLRAQVRIKEAEKFMSAADIAAKHAAGSAGDRAYQNQLLDPKNRFRGTHPMMRNVAASNLETGVGRLGIGRQEEQLDEQTRRFREQALKAMGVDEGDRNFGCEVPIEAQAYWWHNRYAPRKPKYFNRIHTGYEWNKYNQTHYDTENPPPKVVQGYKFNIFYPDLLDRTVAPTYRVEPDPNGSKDTCILVFSAGPPYEDIAFRIVNKEWETTHRRGFKCTYDRGILHLYFNFKRARYRR